MDAVLFLTSVTFVIAVGSAIIQGVTFWKHYRIRVKISNKTPSIHSRELEELAPDTIPTDCQSITGSILATRHRPGKSPLPGIQRPPQAPINLNHPFSFFGATIHEPPERATASPPTPATVSHDATARDRQGFAEAKP
ncbi:hypothetical protein N7532_009407 [Penicillium argentinense]|uniref:Uncharacterized protein n=1 Tax=Penicillium argentinense TaxID=1131581 RepID=A0A9W9EZB8_9EURO|nr:uncharacterized protein N7532_009407 [Penicillium argentinense]KAJ5090723.1 hypothetical protein N7532_009407 [Penicillium argentinense]